MDATSRRCMQRYFETAEHETAVQVTMYGIRLVLGQWAGARRQWVDGPDRALRFHSMTAATTVAIVVLDLAPDAFTVEAI